MVGRRRRPGSTACSGRAARRATRPTSGSRGCSTRPSCAARTRARAASVDLARRSRLPGVRLAVGPEDDAELTAEPGYHGAPVAAVCADTLAQAARAGVEAIAVEWGALEPLLDAEHAIEAGSLIDEDHYERGDVERGLAEADAVVEADVPHAGRAPQLARDARPLCEWHGDELTAYVSTQ